jgi:hypothetical protein
MSKLLLRIEKCRVKIFRENKNNTIIIIIIIIIKIIIIYTNNFNYRSQTDFLSLSWNF